MDWDQKPSSSPLNFFQTSTSIQNRKTYLILSHAELTQWTLPIDILAPQHQDVIWKAWSKNGLIVTIWFVFLFFYTF